MHDVIVIGARCAGATTAMLLARKGHRVVLMDRGRIVADGSKREILTAARLSGLFGLPLDLAERDGYYNLW